MCDMSNNALQENNQELSTSNEKEAQQIQYLSYCKGERLRAHDGETYLCTTEFSFDDKLSFSNCYLTYLMSHIIVIFSCCFVPPRSK